MQDIKEFIVFALKNPLLWGVAIVWLTANIQWLFPTVPSPVINAFTDLFTTIGTLVVAYLGGKYVERQKENRRRVATLMAQKNGEIK